MPPASANREGLGRVAARLVPRSIRTTDPGLRARRGATSTLLVPAGWTNSRRLS